MMTNRSVNPQTEPYSVSRLRVSPFAMPPASGYAVVRTRPFDGRLSVRFETFDEHSVSLVACRRRLK